MKFRNKMWTLFLTFLVFALPVQASIAGDVGSSFRRMLTNNNFLFFLFYVLIFVILFTIFSGASSFIPAFKDNKRMASSFAVALSLLVTTVIFTYYKGNILSALSKALGPYGWWVLLVIAIIVILFFIIGKFGGKGGSGGSLSGPLKWLLIALLIIGFIIFIMNAKGSGGSGSSSGGVFRFSGGGTSDWIFIILSLIFIGWLGYLIFQGMKTGFGGGGTIGSGGSSIGGAIKGLGKGAGKLLSKLNPFNWFKGKSKEEKESRKNERAEKKAAKKEEKAEKKKRNAKPGRGRVSGQLEIEK